LLTLLAWNLAAKTFETVNLVLVVVDPNPAVQIAPQVEAAATLEGPYATPVSTPVNANTPGQDNMPSPGLPPPTVLETLNNDSSVRLVDVSEETWSLIMAPNPAGMMQQWIAEGYLLKRRGWINIKIVSAESEFNFKELLNQYNGLWRLSVARGADEMLPWHIAMARKMHDGLASLVA
jgi:hypothetical protein